MILSRSDAQYFNMKSFLVLCSVCCFAGALAAQNGPLVEAVPTALSAKDTVDWNSTLQTVVVTGQFLPTDIRKTVQNVRILDQKIIERQGAVNLGELLAVQPNIKINNDPILGSSIALNGLNGQNLKILIDGVPVVGRQNGSIDVNQILLSGVKKIEIVQGAQSVMYGSDAAAGVINIITNGGGAKQFHGSLQGQYESQGLHTENLTLGFTAKRINMQVVAGLLNFSPDSTGISRDQVWNPKQQQTAQFNFGFQVSDALKLSLNSRYLQENISNKGPVIRPTFKPYAFDDRYRTQRANASLQAVYSGLKHHVINASLGVDGFFRKKNTDRLNFADQSVVPVMGEQDTSSVTGWLLRATIASDYDSPFNYQLGFEHTYETAAGRRIKATDATTGNATINNSSLFTNLQYQLLKNLKLQLGARLNKNDNYGMAFVPAFSSVYHVTPTSDLRFSYAHGFRSPDLKELYFEFIDVNHYVIGNPNLKAESSRNVWGQWSKKVNFRADQCLKFSVDGFYNTIKNRIALVQVGTGNQYGYVNFYDWKTAEGSATAAYTHDNLFSVSSTLVYTGYFNTLSKTSPDYNSLLWTPDVVSEIWVNVWKAKSAIVTVWHKFNGYLPQYLENDKGEIEQGGIGSWHNLNCSFSIKPVKQLQVSLGVKNLADVRQIGFSAIGEPHAGAEKTRDISWGRSFFVSAKIAIGSKN